MQAFKSYLASFPKLVDMLSDRMSEALEEGSFDVNNSDELRLAYKEAQQVALERIQDQKLPYYVVTYGQVLWKCPECSEETKGAYWELSNPVSNERGMFRVRLIHELLVHDRSEYTEPILNMSDTLMGYDDHTWDIPKLLRILNGLPVPPDVMAELQAKGAENAAKKAQAAKGAA